MKRMKQILIYLFILQVLHLQAQQLPLISSQVDTTTIRIGEQIRLSVTAQTDTLSFADFPEITELGDMEVVSSSQIDTLQKKPVRKLRKDYYLTQWDSGTYQVAPLLVRINDSILSTDSLQIKVQPVAVDTTRQGLYDYKPPISVDGKEITETNNKISPLWWLLLLPLSGLGYYWYKRRKAVMQARKKKLTPYEKAQKTLHQLTKQKLWLKNKVDEHYLKLTDTLKTYLEDELSMSAKEKISSQLLHDLKKFRFEDGSYLSPDLLERLQMMFQRADLAKFAKLQPNPADIDLDFNILKDTIEQSHAVVQAIADTKAAELAAIEVARKRKKQIAWTITGAIFLLLGILGGTAYYYLNKMNLTQTIKENISAPEWVYSEYGTEPVLALTTPHILRPLDISQATDSLPQQVKQLFDEIAVYNDQNIVKKYLILASSMETKQKLPENAQVLDGTINGMLQYLHARNVNLQQAEIENGKRYFGNFITDIPILGNNIKVEFDSRFFQTETSIKYVIGFYLQGNNENKELIERVLQSAELMSSSN